ncbi:MAG: FHA domain-containing protein [Cyanothece sp. SIO1E1]|nr:FHA domain-containing protein [Cyanothece sp. SIO1E1]
MPTESIYVQLMWEDPVTGELQRPLLAPPIALGREIDEMPENLGIESVSRLALNHKQISRFHALITVANEQLYITDRSANGTFLNGRSLHRGSHPFTSKDTLRIGPYKITATLMRENELSATTELTMREHTNLLQSSNPLTKNTVIVWLIGAGLLLLMSSVAWFVVNQLLEKARPQIPANSSSNSHLILLQDFING